MRQEDMECIYWVRYKVRASALQEGEWVDTDTATITREQAVKFARRVNEGGPTDPHSARVMRRLIGPEEEVTNEGQ